MAFQLIDDWLDYAGDQQATGKALFTDLREGKMTYPLLHAYEQDPSVGVLLGEILGADDVDPVRTAALHESLKQALVRTGALDACRALALSHADRAAAVLSPLPDSRAIEALLTGAQAPVHREA